MLQALRSTLTVIVLCAINGFTAVAQSDTFTSDLATADLERLYSGLQSADAGLFAETSQAVFDSAFAELKSKYAEAETVSSGDLHKDFQRFVALAKHGHTRIDGRNPFWDAHIEGDGLVFPLSIRFQQGEVIVAGVPSKTAAQPGDRIISLQGKPNPIWLAELTRNISAETPELAYSLLANTEPYFMLLEYGPMAQFSVELKRGSKVIKTEIDAIGFDQLSELVRMESGFQLNGREANMINKHVAYLRPGPFFNMEATKPGEYFSPESVAVFQEFVDTAFNDFIQKGAEHLILDLRDNPGGDNSFSDPVIAWFADEPFRFASDFRIKVSPETTASNQKRVNARQDGEGGISAKFAELFAKANNGDFVSFELPYAQPREGERFTGDIHVLVNRFSYSNAVSVAALIQDYGFGTVYGEPTRDMSTTYGAMEHFTLPHSGFLVGYPKAHIIRPNGIEESHPVTPDIAIPTPAVRGADDIVIRELLELLKK